MVTSVCPSATRSALPARRKRIRSIEALRKSDYFKAALHLLASGGIGAVTIDAMCYRLGVTKGSFYHHFSSGTVFRRELVHYWEHDQAAQVMPLLEAMDPLERLGALKRMAVDLNHEAASAVRAWARTDKLVAGALARVDRGVEHQLARFLVQAGVPEERAPILARVGMSILIATQQLERRVDRKKLLAALDEYQRWVESTIETPRLASVTNAAGRSSRSKR